MTDKITLELTLDELKLIDKYVELNDETQSVFDKIKYAYPQPQMTFQQEGDYVVVSYNNTTYYRLMGETTFSWYHKKGVSAYHPFPTLVMVTDAETERLLDGIYYNDVVVKKETAQERGERVHNEMEEVVRESVKWCEEHPDTDPLDWLKPQNPEQVADGLKEAFREAVKQGVVSSTKSKTLTDLIYRWWEDVFTTNSHWDMETSIEDLVDQIELFLPKEQSAEGSQNAYVESTVEGFNDCLNTIKRKLR
jgi:hypothetical protein